MKLNNLLINVICKMITVKARKHGPIKTDRLYPIYHNSSVYPGKHLENDLLHYFAQTREYASKLY